MTREFPWGEARPGPLTVTNINGEEDAHGTPERGDAYDQFIKGGAGAVVQLWDDDGVFHVFGRKTPLAKDWHGKLGFTDFFRQLLDLCEGRFELEVVDVLANDDRAVVFVHERARRGTSYEGRHPACLAPR